MSAVQKLEDVIPELSEVSADYAGIGFMFSGSGYFGVDIDDRQDILKQYLDGDENNIFGEFSNQR